MINIEIPNLPKFQKALRKWPQLAEKELKNAFEKSLYQIIRETKPITPIDTGRLRSSIGEQGGKGIFEIKKTLAVVGTNVNYAVDVHEGFQRHKTGQREFLKVGVEKAMSKIKEFSKEAINNIFNKIAKESK